MDQEYDAEFHLPINPALQATANVSAVAEAAKVAVAAEAPEPRILNPVQPANKLSDRDLFDELNSVSEEITACRNRILSNIS